MSAALLEDAFFLDFPCVIRNFDDRVLSFDDGALGFDDVTRRDAAGPCTDLACAADASAKLRGPPPNTTRAKKTGMAK